MSQLPKVDLSFHSSPSVQEASPSAVQPTAASRIAQAALAQQAETPASDSQALVASAAQKKKKKKKEKEQLASQVYTSVFGAAASSSASATPACAKQKPSLSQRAGFPKLNEEETRLFSELFSCRPLGSHFNLLDLFMIDFAESWDAAVKSAEFDKDLHKFLINYKQDFFATFFLAYLYLFALHHAKKSQVVQACYHAEFFRTPDEYVDYLLRYHTGLGNLLTASSQVEGQTPKIREFKEKKKRPLIENLQALQQRCLLMAKFFRDPASCKLLMGCPLAETAEGDVLDTPSSGRMDAASRFSSFLEDFLKFAPGKGVISIRIGNFETFSQLIRETMQGSLTQKKIKRFNEAYRQFSYYDILNLKAKFWEYIHRLHNDPQFTHEVYCRENNIVRKYERDKRAFGAFMLHVHYALEVLDKWINDLNETMSRLFSQPLGGAAYQPPKEYVYRLVSNLELYFAKNTPPSKGAVDPENSILQMLAKIKQHFFCKFEIFFSQALSFLFFSVPGRPAPSYL